MPAAAHSAGLRRLAQAASVWAAALALPCWALAANGDALAGPTPAPNPGWVAALSTAPSPHAGVAAPATGGDCPALLRHSPKRLQDEVPQALCAYAGRVLLVVNTASYCGFTSQFEGLEALNARYAARGLVVLGFPSNDFKQEDADARETAKVCFNTYGVKFPMFATGPVRGSDAQALFRQLAAATGKAPTWNFNKYLVGRDGQALAHFGSTTGPTSASLVGAIEKALAAPLPR